MEKLVVQWCQLYIPTRTFSLLRNILADFLINLLIWKQSLVNLILDHQGQVSGFSVGHSGLKGSRSLRCCLQIWAMGSYKWFILVDTAQGLFACWHSLDFCFYTVLIQRRQSRLLSQKLWCLDISGLQKKLGKREVIFSWHNVVWSESAIKVIWTW